MPKFRNTDKTTPMSVNHEGNTYIVPPGGTLNLPDSAPATTGESPKPNSVEATATEESPKKESRPKAKKPRVRKKEGKVNESE